MFPDIAWHALARSLKLSGRELQIAQAIFDDTKESAIAADLQIAPRTVHTHTERLYRKLRIGNRTQLLIRLMREFLALTTSLDSALTPICSKNAAGHCPFHDQGWAVPGARPVNKLAASVLPE